MLTFSCADMSDAQRSSKETLDLASGPEALQDSVSMLTGTIVHVDPRSTDSPAF